MRKKTSVAFGPYGKFFRLFQNKQVEGFRAFVDFLMDKNETVNDAGLRNLYEMIYRDKFQEDYPGNKYEDLVIVHFTFKKPEINIISPKYTTFDMIGNFGGQFGLFEQVTGASFLGLINLIILLFKLIFSNHRHA